MTVITGMGYDLKLPSKPPFMYIESERVVELGDGDCIRLIAFGAYNAQGLIGPEKGGVAVVHDDPNFVIGTQDIPYDEVKRELVMQGLENQIGKMLERKGECLTETREKVMMALRSRKFDLRFES